MAYQARWGNKGFIIDSTKIVPLMGLATTRTRKTNTANDTSGTPATNTTGMELQRISFETIYVAGAGVDPRAQIDDWNAQFGQQHPFVLNGKRFGPELMELESVDFSDFILDNQGQIHSMKCAVVLVEYVSQADKVSTTAVASGLSDGATTSGSSGGGTAGVGIFRGLKKSALDARPKPSEKNKKKPINDFEDGSYHRKEGDFSGTSGKF